jgi:CheY-like chemotaxis protein
MARILLIEDEPDIRYLTRAVLEKAGHTVLEAEDGEDGLRKLKMSRPDLILLDIMLPGMDGWEVCQKIKNDENLKDIPIAIITVKGKDEDVLESIQCDADMHIVKPFQKAWLLETVEALLELSS